MNEPLDLLRELSHLTDADAARWKATLLLMSREELNAFAAEVERQCQVMLSLPDVSHHDATMAFEILNDFQRLRESEDSA